MFLINPETAPFAWGAHARVFNHPCDFGSVVMETRKRYKLVILEYYGLVREWYYANDSYEIVLPRLEMPKYDQMWLYRNYQDYEEFITIFEELELLTNNVVPLRQVSPYFLKGNCFCDNIMSLSTHLKQNDINGQIYIDTKAENFLLFKDNILHYDPIWIA